MHVKYNFFLFIGLLLNLNLHSQENFISYDKVKIESISSIENSFNSKVYEEKFESVESNKDSIIRYGKLKIYSRPENKYFGKIDVKYYYLKSDEIVKRITYSWRSSSSKLKDYSKQFDKMVRKISADLNLNIGDQGKLIKIMDDTVNGIPVATTERRVTWKYKDAKILILMIWTEEHGAYVSTDIKWEK